MRNSHVYTVTDRLGRPLYHPEPEDLPLEIAACRKVCCKLFVDLGDEAHEIAHVDAQGMPWVRVGNHFEQVYAP